MPPEVKEKQQMDRMEQNLSGVSARFDELTARFESSINSLKDAMRTQSADLNAHTDQYNSRFVQIEHAFEALQMTLNQQSMRLTALEQTAGWVSSLMTAGQPQPNVGKGGLPGYGMPPAGGNTTANTTSGTAAATGTPVADSGAGGGGASGATVVSRDAATAAKDDGAAGGGSDGKKVVYPEVANASSYVGASLQAGGAMIATPSLSRGWTQALAFAPAAVGLVDDMVADVDNKKALQRAAASAIAGGALLLLAKAIK
jgi:hypothetical protein